MESENILKEDEESSDVDFEKLRCGKCKGYLNCPPIMVFHGRDNYAECGRCFNAAAADRESLHPLRNRSLELLTNVTPFPCKNLKNGCNERRTWPQLEIHESQCLHGSFVCPLSFLTSCMYRGEIECLLGHFREKHSDLLLLDGLLNETFNKNFEKTYVVYESSHLFVFQVKYDLDQDIAWFIVKLLEEKIGSEFKLEFTSDSLQGTFLTKHGALFKPITVLDVNEAVEINIKAIKTLLKEPQNIKCKVSLSSRLSTLHSLDLMKEIRCPVCWDYMKRKIYMCSNGHNVCAICQEFSVHCPTCRDKVLESRNHSLEKLISHALFPCKNHNAGCRYIGTLDDLLYHFDHCSLTTPD